MQIRATHWVTIWFVALLAALPNPLAAPRTAVEHHRRAAPRTAVEHHRRAAPRTAVEPHRRVEPRTAVEPHRRAGPRAAPEPRALQGTVESSRLLQASSTAAWSETAASCAGGGHNDYGQLGTYSTTYSPLPLQFQGLTAGVTAIAAGRGHTCVLVDGGVKCWGANWRDQLGSSIAGNDLSLVPMQVEGLTAGVTSIAGGNMHTCAVVSGRATCWGSDEYGQLGSNTAGDSQVPVGVLLP